MSWRITRSKSRTTINALNRSTGTVAENTLLRASERIELRDGDGTIVRLGVGAEFELKNGPLGVRPEYFGPVFVSRKGGCGKYRTSCWFGEANPLSERPDIFMKPGDEPNVDEFHAISGDVVVYEIDEESRTFTICTIHEGEKAIIHYDPNADTMRARYRATVVPFSDAEYDYVLREFIDRRLWT